MRVAYVKSYLQLGFGQNAYMKSKSGKSIKIHRKHNSGDFGLGWKDKYFSKDDLNYCERR